MRALLLLVVACGDRSTATPAPAVPAVATPTWAVPAGWKAETIPFPLEFAPMIIHRGVEELRFAPGMFDPAQPGYWSYTFAWRIEDPAEMDPEALATELTGYFRGLIGAVDTENRITDREAIVVKAAFDGPRIKLAAHVFDAFKTGQPVDLVGWARRTACGSGALWIFVFAPEHAKLRGELDALAAAATCAAISTH